MDSKGKPVWVIGYAAGGYSVRAVHSNGSAVEAEPRPDMGGLFSMEGLRPGIYDVWVPALKNAEGKYRAQRILGVVVKPGVRTMLNIVVVEGRSTPGNCQTSVHGTGTHRRARTGTEQLQRQLDAVQQQVAELKK